MPSNLHTRGTTCFECGLKPSSKNLCICIILESPTRANFGAFSTAQPGSTYTILPHQLIFERTYD